MANEEIVKEEGSYLSMSDDDIGKVDIGAASLQASEAPVDTAVEEDLDLEVKDDAVVEAAVIDPAKEDTDDDQTATPAPVVADPANGDHPTAKLESETPKEAAEAIDYKAAYERLIAPFKANGRDIAVNNVDDAIQLMQMGANYNKKMAALKPNLKVLKLLENNGLLSEDKLSYLIDLDKKNPEAIGKLLKDSGIDPLDLATDKPSEYKPKKYAVDDLEIELDTVLDELQDTPTYTKTLDIVSNKWDASSKQVIAQSPQILKVINNHVQSGIYDQIQAEIERERVFGRLNGLSDIEAYRQVGDAIQARGGFDHLGHQRQQTPPPVVVQPKPKPADDDKLKDKKRAASTSKPSGASSPAEFNPLSLSDEDFEKQINGKYI